jgi:GT2 family glycosyltransferase
MLLLKSNEDKCLPTGMSNACSRRLGANFSGVSQSKPSMADPQIALVVCTKNRGHRLERFFDAIKRLHYDHEWELIIVDGSSDDTPERLREFASSFSGRITIISEPRPGHELARNRGWQASMAPIIAFTDDDCYPDKDFLNDVETVFADRSLGFAGGRILLYDPTDGPTTTLTSSKEKFIAAGDFVHPGFIQGANMAFRRQALTEIDGFDWFRAGDVDAALRASAAGWKGKYDPRPTVYHHHGRKPGKDIEALRRAYDFDRGEYYMKCILFLPQRWLCLQNWIRSILRQRNMKAAREVYSAIRYLFRIICNKPNNAY